MKTIFRFSTFFLFTFCLFGIIFSQTALPSSFVNNFIGTGAHGHTFPGATLPFGMIQLSPDTRLDGWDGSGGYHFSDDKIHGFSHTHLSGTGVSDYGDLLIMPFTGKDKWVNDVAANSEKGYSSTFSHTNETASPGFYSVQLQDDNIRAELTTTERCGMHRYTFPPLEKRKIIIDLEHRDELLQSDLIFLNDSTVVGNRVSKKWANEQHFYFCLRTSEQPIHYRFKKNSDGVSTKLILEFAASSTPLSLKVGISSVDIQGAKNNLTSEMSHWKFSQYLKEGKEKWNTELGKIEVKTKNEDDLHIFYTALYHSFICPNVFSDADGRYRGMDMKIHEVKSAKQYTVFSLWDTFRATHPLFTIIQRERTNEFVNTLLRHFKDGGILPIWELNANYTECMIGYHSVSVIADALIKGIDDFDLDEALEAMVYSADQNHRGLASYKKYGFVNSEEEIESVSKTLEYAYDDWCIGVFAKKIGNDSIAKRFFKRSQSYKHVFNPYSKFMQPRHNGNWKDDFEPTEVNFDYTESNSMQTSLFVPQDIEGLIDLMGGKVVLENWLDVLFTTDLTLSGKSQVDITGLIGQYAHGNEPSHHIAYLYNYTNSPHKAQKYLNQIMKTLYSNTPEGLSGNEDCGQMSSWYIFSALGFYPVTPGSPYYLIGTPNLEYAKLNLENGNSFEIKVSNLSSMNFYVAEVKLNGNVLNRNYLLNNEIMVGGVLEFKMTGEKTNFNLNHPPLKNYGPKIPPAPFSETSEISFKRKKIMHLKSADSLNKIEYYISSEKNKGSKAIFRTYKKPIKIKKTSTIIYRSKTETMTSPEIASSFYKRSNSWRYTLSSPYHNQYPAGGEGALINKLYGGDNFSDGNWQGYNGRNLDFEINFRKKIKIKKVSVGFLQDARSWIWMPSEVQFMISENGKDWFTIEVVKNSIPRKTNGTIIKQFGFKKEIKTKYLRIVGKYVGPCPKWHAGAGKNSFIFADEITVNQ